MVEFFRAIVAFALVGSSIIVPPSARAQVAEADREVGLCGFEDADDADVARLKEAEKLWPLDRNDVEEALDLMSQLEDCSAFQSFTVNIEGYEGTISRYPRYCGIRSIDNSRFVMFLSSLNHTPLYVVEYRSEEFLRSFKVPWLVWLEERVTRC